MLRLDNNTPAKIALQTTLKEVPKRRGRSKTTWIDTIKKDLKESNLQLNFKNNKIMFDELENLSRDTELCGGNK